VKITPERAGVAIAWAAMAIFVFWSWDEKATDALRIAGPIVIVLSVGLYAILEKLDTIIRAIEHRQ